MRATPGKWAEYSAKEKEKLWLRIQQLWPNIRQGNELWLSIQRNYGRGFGKRKEIWLRFQQIQGVANLISKHERGRKMEEICVMWYVWLKALKLCVVILLYYMDD